MLHYDIFVSPRRERTGYRAIEAEVQTPLENMAFLMTSVSCRSLL